MAKTKNEKADKPQELLTTAEAAKRLKVEAWQVSRLYLHGDLPEPPRFMEKRVIFPDDLPTIRKALKKRGWLKRAKREPQPKATSGTA